MNPIGTRSCYDEGNWCAETLFFDYWRQHRTKIKVPRTFNTYGPNMHPQDGRVVSNFIVQALANRPITLYVDDMAVPRRRPSASTEDLSRAETAANRQVPPRPGGAGA